MTDGSGTPARTIGVIGAGTMGAGIAQLACRSGARTLLFDAQAGAVERASARMASDFEKLVARGKLEAADAAAATARLEPTSNLSDLSPCDLVVEAIPESLDLKRQLVATLDELLAPGCVIASNTSSLLVTAIATGSKNPARVVGMHFFNPPPVMRLLEVVAGAESSDAAIATASATGEAMGKDVIVAHDGPGFLVNRVNRPFLLEALKLVADGVASFEVVDRAVRQGGGFRMGPFELSDLVGIEVGFEIAKSFAEQSFGEPRWRPSPIAARYVAAGRFGRKTGRGYYEYGDQPHRPDDPDPREPAGGAGTVCVLGEGSVASELRETIETTYWREARMEEADLIVDCRLRSEGGTEVDRPVLTLCDDGALRERDQSGRGVGFHVLPPFTSARAVETVRRPASDPALSSLAESFFADLGKHTIQVEDGPGLVLGRIVSQLVNEALYALTEGVGSAEDVDAGMVLGLNHPRGPLEWADLIGPERVLATLDGLHRWTGDPRYRAAPLLRRLAADAMAVHSL